MKISEAKLAANRANAKKSTGPQTPEGKAISSGNSTRHGFCGRIILLDPENRELYSRIGKRYVDDLKPIGALEEQFVRTLVDNEWQINRIRARIEQVSSDIEADITPEFERLARYQATLERSSYKAADQLRRQQKVRIDAENYDDMIKFEDQLQKPYNPRSFGHLPRLHQLIGFVSQESPIWRFFDRMESGISCSPPPVLRVVPEPGPDTPRGSGPSAA